MRRRIMHVVIGLGTGGTEVMCLRLADYWQHSFEQMVVSWSGASKALEAQFRGLSNVTLMLAPLFRNDVQRWAWFRAVVKQYSPDAVMIHTFGRPHLIAAHAARSAGVHSVVASAGNPPSQSKSERRHWSAILVASRLVHCPVISCSRTVDRELRDLGIGMPAGSMSIPNAIDVDNIARAVAKAHDHRQKSPVIGMIARLNRIKDHDTLLRAFSRVRNGHPNAELWIIGDGPLRETLENRATELGISSSACFLGERADAARMLGEIDIYAFSTTRDEGFGIALIEAMAAGVPIIATDVPACREVLADGEAGVLVPPGDDMALARAISHLLKSQAERARLIKAARARVEREYSIGVYAARWERVLFPATNADRGLNLRCAS